ncbi:helix-turn-helix domain-containing protein [Deinococcus sedimenti]|uniref:helix-turn-helix domain-containing protein n=1 Tax=Deinococcus sedimenti TaxID=1867090 RepID=UPI001669DC21|nr:helix-turn-helix transcriptional regulator [Deinococcus sedimenti]
MNREIRQEVKALMRARGITQDQMADQMGMKRTNLNQMLNSDTELPQRWQEILQILGKKIALVDADDTGNPS